MDNDAAVNWSLLSLIFLDSVVKMMVPVKSPKSSFFSFSIQNPVTNDTRMNGGRKERRLCSIFVPIKEEIPQRICPFTRGGRAQGKKIRFAKPIPRPLLSVCLGKIEKREVGSAGLPSFHHQQQCCILEFLARWLSQEDHFKGEDGQRRERADFFPWTKERTVGLRNSNKTFFSSSSFSSFSVRYKSIEGSPPSSPF